MSTYEQTKRLARLIGLDYHASESKQKVWRQTVILGRKWPEWWPYGCEADLEPIKAWLAQHHSGWRLANLSPTPAMICDAVLAAFAPEPEPTELAEHNDAMRNEWRERAERAEAECKRLQSYTYCAYCGEGHALDGDAATVTQHIATCEKHPMRKVEAERDEWQERCLRAEAECKRLTAIVADRNEAIAVLQDVIEEQAANATERGE